MSQSYRTKILVLIQLSAGGPSKREKDKASDLLGDLLSFTQENRIGAEQIAHMDTKTGEFQAYFLISRAQRIAAWLKQHGIPQDNPPCRRRARRSTAKQPCPESAVADV